MPIERFGCVRNAGAKWSGVWRQCVGCVSIKICRRRRRRSVVATAPPGRQAVVNGFGSATTASAAAVLGGGGSGGGGSSKLLRSCPSLFMFMFRSRRNALVKRLWRQAALRGEPDDGDEDEAEENQAAAAAEEQQVKSWIKSAAHALFKRLTDDQLALLLDALDGAGASASPCLPLDTDLVNSKRERKKKDLDTFSPFTVCLYSQGQHHSYYYVFYSQQGSVRKAPIDCCVVSFAGRNCPPELN